MVTKTIYEVHTLKGGRWVVDSTYPDKENAMEMARSLHGEKSFDGIKVIKDSFDEATGDGKEIVVYDSSKVSRERASAGASPPASAKEAKPAAPRADVDFRPRSATKKSGRGDGAVAVRAVLMLTVILLGGLGVLYLIAGASNFVERLF